MKYLIETMKRNLRRAGKNWLSTALVLFVVVLPQFIGPMGCGGDDGPDLLIYPSIVVVDSNNDRIFVIDNEGNRLNLIEASTLEPFTKGDNQPLVSDEDPLLFQAFPSNGAVVDLGGGTSRIFIIGANSTPSQDITVLDYAGGDLPVVAPISPIVVPSASTQDILVGLAVDPIRGYLLVTNASTGQLHVYDIDSGLEVAGSPIVIGGAPTRLAIDLNLGLAAVANSSSNAISFIDLTNLAAAPVTLDVGLPSRDVALATSPSGSLLFLTGFQTNVALVYQLDLADLSASTLTFQQDPATPTEPRPDPELLSGNLNFVAAGLLSDGQVGAYFPQSSGDLYIINLPGDFSSVNPVILVLGAVSGEGVATLENGAGQVIQVYFASPGVGNLSVVNPLDNGLVDQIP